MNYSEIKVRFIGTGRDVSEETWLTEGLEYVEDLVQAILEKRVGPVHRTLFGLRSVDEPNLWYAPNTKIQTLFKAHDNQAKTPTVELRMRFRPSCFNKLATLDPSAFEIIFAQIRYDFVHTKFSLEKRDFLLLNESVLIIIATDVLRYAKENNINENEIFERIDHNEFIPRRVPRWQRSQLFRWPDKLSLQTTVNNGIKNTDADVTRIKRTYLETFLQEACPDYGSETYITSSAVDPANKQLAEIRLRYSQTTKDSTCIIEYRSKNPKKSKISDEWIELCDIYSISYGSMRDSVVEINRSNGRPFRVKFQDANYARSFLSLIDGYYRLMRKWNFNFCCDVSSPFLQRLKRIKCHGPIGFQTAREKLSKPEKPGTFLVRLCMEKNNRFLIDAWLGSGLSLIIDIVWDPDEQAYRKVEHQVNREITVDVILENPHYKSLKDLINDTQIRVIERNGNVTPLQLKYWLPPSEYDDYPALLLSISKQRLKDFDNEKENICSQGINELPRVIPPEMILFLDKTVAKAENDMIVRVATVNNEQTVVVKSPTDEKFEGCILSLGHMRKGLSKFLSTLLPAQARLTDWTFIKSNMFAETIGLGLDGAALIQEYFPIGSLDKYLSSQGSKVTESTRRSISCQLANALLFLQDKRIIHGKIRCHNVFVKAIDPISIKISDPLGTFNSIEDQAFLPPEHSGLTTHLFVRDYDSGIDVWALGTTIWQIYSGGIRPPANRYANNTLLQPDICPDEVWGIIEQCWIVEPDLRASPQVIFRDLNDSFSWKREPHDYEDISRPNLTIVQAQVNHQDSYTPQRAVPAHSSYTASTTASNLSGSEANLLPMFDAESIATECDSSPWQIERSRIKLGLEIGRGSSGIVIKGVLSQWEGLSEQVVAVKCINGSAPVEFSCADDLKREFEILKNLKHQNIVQTLGFVDDDCLMVVVEYMPLGSLLSCLKNSHHRSVSNLPLMKYALDISRGMEYLESQRVVHRDLALRNILLKSRDEVKICDFGLAQYVGSSGHYTLKTDRALPLRWFAPESLETWTFSHKSDVWSYGVVLWEMYSGGSSPQYSGLYPDLIETLKNERLLMPKDCPTAMYNLMLSCWAYHPDDRESFSQVCVRLESMGDTSVSSHQAIVNRSCSLVENSPGVAVGSEAAR